MKPDPHYWKRQAACKASPDLFFAPPGREGTHQRDEREAAAKALCATCPVLGTCLDHSLGRPGEPVVPGGIWGGMNEVERAKEKRNLRRRAA